MSRTITVNGTGHAHLSPDLTVISLTVSQLNENYDLALSGNAEAHEKLCEALAAVGFAPDALKTADFNVSTEYRSERAENGEYRSVFAGYRCTQRLTLEFPFDTRLLSRVLTAVTKTVTEPELNVQFTVKDKTAAEDLLLRDAAVNARKKAEVLAQAGGFTLGPLQAVEYHVPDHAMFSRTSYTMEAKCAMMDCGVNMAITPEAVELTDQVTFVWEIR